MSRYFGPLPRGPIPPSPTHRSPGSAGVVERTIPDPVARIPQLQMVWNGVKPFAPEEAAGDVLSVVLGGSQDLPPLPAPGAGEAAGHRRLRLATPVSAWVATSRWWPPSATGTRSPSCARRWMSVLETARAVTGPPTREVERAKRNGGGQPGPLGGASGGQGRPAERLRHVDRRPGVPPEGRGPLPGSDESPGPRGARGRCFPPTGCWCSIPSPAGTAPGARAMSACSTRRAVLAALLLLGCAGPQPTRSPSPPRPPPPADAWRDAQPCSAALGASLQRAGGGGQHTCPTGWACSSGRTMRCRWWWWSWRSRPASMEIRRAGPRLADFLGGVPRRGNEDAHLGPARRPAGGPGRLPQRLHRARTASGSTSTASATPCSRRWSCWPTWR